MFGTGDKANFIPKNPKLHNNYNSFRPPLIETAIIICSTINSLTFCCFEKYLIKKKSGKETRMFATGDRLTVDSYSSCIKHTTQNLVANAAAVDETVKT